MVLRNCPKFVKKLYASPALVFAIEDYTARYYTIMRMGIERNVTLVVTANPSTIVEMQNNVNEYFEDYCNDIEYGTLKASLNIPQWIRDDVQPYLKPNPERANELRALKAKYGTVLPKHYWPNLQILNTWKCGNTRVYVEKFKDSFPAGMLHQEFGYFASECRFGLVLDDTLNTVLFPHFHYYEFVAEDELESENKHFLQLWELERGKRYCPYVTTFAGLYRYNMNDLVEVGDSFCNTPTVHMIQKVKDINIEYAAKRASFRVKDPLTHRLVGQSFEKFKAECIAEGARDGQFKLNLLLQDEKRHAKFKKLVLE